MHPLPESEAGAHPTTALPQELVLWLDRALGAAGVQRLAGAESEIRDTVLRALAQRFYPGVPTSTQAARIQTRAATYAFVEWPRDRHRNAHPGAPSRRPRGVSLGGVQVGGTHAARDARAAPHPDRHARALRRTLS